MYVVDIKNINEIYDFRIQVFRAMGAEEAASWLESDRKNILQYTFIAEDVQIPRPPKIGIDYAIKW